MQLRTPVALAPIAVLSLALYGCGGAVTIHPLPVEFAEPAPDLSGVWAHPAPGGGDSLLALSFSRPNDPPLPNCGGVAMSDISPVSGQVEALTPDSLPGDELCFYRFGDHVVAQWTARAPNVPMPLYRHYLVRVDEQQFELCGPTGLWDLLLGREDELPPAWREGLDFRHWRDGESVYRVVLSEGAELGAYLSAHLAELAVLCASDEGSELRLTFRRVRESPPPPAASAAD